MNSFEPYYTLFPPVFKSAENDLNLGLSRNSAAGIDNIEDIVICDQDH